MYEQRDRAAVVDLIKDHMPLPGYSEEYFAWKSGYRLNVDGNESAWFGVVAAEGDRVVSFESFFPYRYHDGRIAWNLDDMVTHCDFRRQGLSRAVMAHGLSLLDARNEPSYLFSSAMAVNGYRSLGYRETADLPYLICIPSMTRLLSTMLPRALRPCRPPTGPEEFASWRDPQGKCFFSPVTRFPPEVEQCCRGGAWGLPLLRKDAAFLKWRFFNHPSRRYSCFLMNDDSGEVRGYLVLSPVNFLDFGLDDRSDALPLFTFAKRFFSRSGTVIGNTFIAGPRGLLNAARRAGFRPWNAEWRPAGLYRRRVLMLREAGGRTATVPENFFFTMSDINCGI